MFTPCLVYYCYLIHCLFKDLIQTDNTTEHFVIKSPVYSIVLFSKTNVYTLSKMDKCVLLRNGVYTLSRFS
jgi:hypothetical protein